VHRAQIDWQLWQIQYLSFSQKKQFSLISMNNFKMSLANKLLPKSASKLN
jgi:hypothetical protein